MCMKSMYEGKPENHRAQDLALTNRSLLQLCTLLQSGRMSKNLAIGTVGDMLDCGWHDPWILMVFLGSTKSCSAYEPYTRSGFRC